MGFNSGRSRAYEMRLQAQQALCQVEIEKNGHDHTEKSQPEKLKDLDSFLTGQMLTLSLPGTAGDKLGLFDFKKYTDLAQEYLKNKEEYADQFIEKFGALNLEDLWDGNGVNENAVLTVFRHLDSATVVKGLVGDTPLSGWVVDYPLLERIHYLLVAG